jgi:hypothetical protein
MFVAVDAWYPFFADWVFEMNHTTARALVENTEPGTVAGDMPCGMVRDDRGSAVESDPTVIIGGLRGEMDRVCLTNDSSCICIISPDGAADDPMMDVLGQTITSSLRSIDALYRFADDKYLIMLPQVDRDGAVYLIKKLREQLLSERLPIVNDDGSVYMTASYGGTMLEPTAALHEHMDRASEAHSWALKGMGDTICMWTPRF